MAAKPKLSPEEWNHARKIWEADERKGFPWLIEELDLPVSAEALRLRSKSEGWTKGGKPSLEAKTKLGASNKSKLGEKPKTKAKSIAVIAKNNTEDNVADKFERGRPTLYKPEYAEQAEEFCRMGATDATLAEQFEVDERTINNWKIEHPDFFQSIKAGKVVADAKMASALYKSGMGLHVITEDKLVSDGNGGQEVVTLEKKIEPSVAAQRYWLNNRQPKHWKDKVEAPIEINLNVFPAKEVLDSIYAKALEEAAKRDQKLIGRRERLGILIEHD